MAVGDLYLLLVESPGDIIKSLTFEAEAGMVRFMKRKEVRRLDASNEKDRHIVASSVHRDGEGRIIAGSVYHRSWLDRGTVGGSPEKEDELRDDG